MRICLISREFPPDTGWGGVGVYTYHTANVLAEKGHDVQVITLAGKLEPGKPESLPFAVYKGVSIHRVEWEEIFDELNLFLVASPSSHFVMKSGISIWKKFLELHSKEPFDIVESPEHLAAGIFHAITSVAPLLVTLHTPHSKFVSENFHSVSPNFDNQLICLLERLSIRQADLVTSPSEDLAKFVANDTGLDLEQIELYKNPVDTSQFAPEGKKIFEANENIKIIFVGRLEDRKGVTVLVEAIPKVCREVENIEFIFVGGDTDTAPAGTSMKEHLQKNLNTHNCLDKVSFVSHIPIEEMPAYYRSGDICVIPSLYDNAPYTCIEALASGKPVIVSSAGGTKEYVLEDVSGKVFPKSDSDSLADAIVELALDQKKRLAYSRAAREYAEENLDLGIYAERKEILYKEAVNRFESSIKSAVYGLSPKQSLKDSVDILCAFDQMIFDVLHKQSIEFRIRFWFRLLKRRPKLALMKSFVGSVNSILKLLKVPKEKISFVRSLELKIESKTGNAFEVTKAWASLPEYTSEYLENSSKASLNKSMVESS